MRQLRTEAFIVFGFNRTGEKPIKIFKQSSELGIAKVKCLECGGTGKGLWPEDDEWREMKCVPCKGTGQIYIDC